MKRVIKPEQQTDYLNQFKGANAQIWLYHVSLKRLAIRLSWSINNIEEKTNDALYIVGLGCESIHGTFSWKSADIRIYELDNNDSDSDVIYIISDEKNKFKLTCSGGVNLAIGPESELDQSFVNFFGDHD